MSAELDTSRIIRIDRVIEAPCALVFEALSDARHLDAWWGPDGFTNETHDLTFKVGGLWRYTMHGPDGKVWPNWIRYTEIIEPSRIAYDHGGEIDEPAHFSSVITLDEENGKTRMTLSLLFPNAEAKQAVMKFGAVEGGKQTLAKLAAFIEARQA